MDVNRSEESCQSGLAFSLGLIDDYERDQVRVQEQNPVRPRTAEEIRRECDAYRRRAYRVWEFPRPLPPARPGEPPGPPSLPLAHGDPPCEAVPAPTFRRPGGHGPRGEE